MKFVRGSLGWLSDTEASSKKQRNPPPKSTKRLRAPLALNRQEPWPSRCDTANVSERHCVETTESDPGNTSVHQPCHPRLTKEKSIHRLAPLDAEHFPNFSASLHHGPATPNLDKTILLSTHIHTLPPPFLPNASIGYPSVTTTQSQKKTPPDSTIRNKEELCVVRSPPQARNFSLTRLTHK